MPSSTLDNPAPERQAEAVALAAAMEAVIDGRDGAAIPYGRFSIRAETLVATQAPDVLRTVMARRAA